jgi:predicted amidohydrolase
MKIQAAVVQLSAGKNKKDNLAKAIRMVERACEGGAKLVALPENFLFRGTDREFRGIPEALNGSSMTALVELARKRKIYLLAGSIAEMVARSKKTYNTSCLIGPTGKIEAVYRKMHLFDVDLPGKRIRESDRCLRGKKPVTGLMTLGKGAAAGSAAKSIRCGLSICYDLRFPELYRGYALAGAQILFIPSNFTRQTGQDHWEPLLRARAIENQCFVLAPGQSGIGSQGVLSHGSSMILDPWGRVLARARAAGESVIFANLDFAALSHIRRRLPSLTEAARPSQQS